MVTLVDNENIFIINKNLNQILEQGDWYHH